MNFLKKSSMDEIEESLVKNIENLETEAKDENNNKLMAVIASLYSAADILDCSNFEKEAEVITSLLLTLANDPATSGLTSEKMLANLANVGWCFNSPGQKSKKPSKKKNLDSFLADDKPEAPEEELVVEEDSEEAVED